MQRGQLRRERAVAFGFATDFFRIADLAAGRLGPGFAVALVFAFGLGAVVVFLSPFEDARFEVACSVD